MGLPWVRLESNIATHDKIMAVTSTGTAGYRAAFAYVCSLGWSGGQGTDGFIPTYMLSVLHANEKVADILVQHRLWEPAPGGYLIPNFVMRQEAEVVSEANRLAKKIGGMKGACKKNHGPDCGCWRDTAAKLTGDAA